MLGVVLVGIGREGPCARQDVLGASENGGDLHALGVLNIDQAQAVNRKVGSLAVLGRDDELGVGDLLPRDLGLGVLELVVDLALGLLNRLACDALGSSLGLCIRAVNHGNLKGARAVGLKLIGRGGKNGEERENFERLLVIAVNGDHDPRALYVGTLGLFSSLLVLLLLCQGTRGK